MLDNVESVQAEIKNLLANFRTLSSETERLRETNVELIKRNSFLESELVGIEQIKTESDKNKHNYCEILKAYDYVKKELEAEKDRFKLWTDAGKTVNVILNNQSLYQTVCLGYNEEEDKNTKPISFSSPVQFVKPGGEPVKEKVLNTEKVSNTQEFL